MKKNKREIKVANKEEIMKEEIKERKDHNEQGSGNVSVTSFVTNKSRGKALDNTVDCAITN